MTTGRQLYTFPWALGSRLPRGRRVRAGLCATHIAPTSTVLTARSWCGPSRRGVSLMQSTRPGAAGLGATLMGAAEAKMAGTGQSGKEVLCCSVAGGAGKERGRGLGANRERKPEAGRAGGQREKGAGQLHRGGLPSPHHRHTGLETPSAHAPRHRPATYLAGHGMGGRNGMGYGGCAPPDASAPGVICVAPNPAAPGCVVRIRLTPRRLGPHQDRASSTVEAI